MSESSPSCRPCNRSDPLVHSVQSLLLKLPKSNLMPFNDIFPPKSNIILRVHPKNLL